MSEAAVESRETSRWQLPPGLINHWPAVLGLLVMGVPTLISLGQQTWTTELGAHGPMVLATGLWLLHRSWPRAAPTSHAGQTWVMMLALAVALPLYVFGRAYDFISIEVFAFYLVAIAITYGAIGGAALWTLAFPLLYLAFVIPPPGWIIDQATAPLQQFVSTAVTHILQWCGYPVINNGVTIYIGSYQLLVEQACSGMNSIVGLFAITLFYIYVLHRSSLGYALLLTAFILPIAVVANCLRVLTLVLITYYLGDAAAQGFLHVTTGLVLFFTALILILAVDAVLRQVVAFVQRRRT